MSTDTTTAPGYPLRYDVEYPGKHSRLLNGLWPIKLILAVPHLLILYALGAVASLMILISFFAILFTKKYPKGLFDFVVNVYRWNANVGAYLGMLRDEYPPFSWEPGKYPVTYEVDYPDELGRFAPLYKWLLAIPNIIVLYLVVIVAILLWVVAWFAIVITGKMPQGIFNFLTGVSRWSYRTSAYYAQLLTDAYPPFSLK
jgi:hypothetical protein